MGKRNRPAPSVTIEDLARDKLPATDQQLIDRAEFEVIEFELRTSRGEKVMARLSKRSLRALWVLAAIGIGWMVGRNDQSKAFSTRVENECEEVARR